MEFVRADSNDANGTHLQGYVQVTYRELTDVFGRPHSDGDGYKVDAEWMIKFPDGEVATIYNWKNGPNYCGDEGIPTRDITTWHIGGNKREVTKRVAELLGKRRDIDRPESSYFSFPTFI